jgi:IPT/TIG domain
MRRLITICLLALSAVALLAAAPIASAAVKPQITRVTPMRISVGNLLTIRGKHFKARAKRNTVIFRAGNGRTAFAKPRRASGTKLVVRVPAAVAGLLTVKNSRQRPTRLKLRVLAGKFSDYTGRRLSPVVTGAGDGDGGNDSTKVCKDDSDHDNDLLSNDLELQIGTDPCLDDTDGDNMIDGWEYFAAKDLNLKAVPYPGKRPFPNALDPSDGASGTFSSYDFDGDGLTTLEEFRAWRITGKSFIASKAGGLDLESPLGYSDGTKYSRAAETPSVPAWRSSQYGLSNPTQPFPATYDLFGDTAWRDSERDADRDGLSNRIESSRGPSNNAWWKKFWANEDNFSPAIEPLGKKYYCAPGPVQSPGYYDKRPYADLDLADPDVDGDNLLDGEDDQDNDDVDNITEIYETEFDLDGNGGPPPVGFTKGINPPWCGYGNDPVPVPSISFGGVDAAVNPFNPCAPNMNSRTCPDYIEL